MHDTDYIASVLLELLRRCSAGQQCSQTKSFSLKARTYDMKSAYKQFGVSKQDRDRLRLAVWDPHSERTVLYGSNVLPFGGAGSVGGFLRVSSAVHSVGESVFKIAVERVL